MSGREDLLDIRDEDSPGRALPRDEPDSHLGQVDTGHLANLDERPVMETERLDVAVAQNLDGIARNAGSGLRIHGNLRALLVVYPDIT